MISSTNKYEWTYTTYKPPRCWVVSDYTKSIQMDGYWCSQYCGILEDTLLSVICQDPTWSVMYQYAHDDVYLRENPMWYSIDHFVATAVPCVKSVDLV